MANRWRNQFPQTYEKVVVTAYANVTFAASGVPTLVTANSKGVLGITQNGTGDYTFTFGTTSNGAIQRDVYVKLLQVNSVFQGASSGASAPAAPIISVRTNSVSTAGTASLRVLTIDYAGAAANPASGEIGYFEFTFGDSTAP